MWVVATLDVDIAICYSCSGRNSPWRFLGTGRPAHRCTMWEPRRHERAEMGGEEGATRGFA